MATSTDLRSAIEEVQQSLPAEGAGGEELVAEHQVDWASSLERRLGAMPWWVISATVHAVLFLLMALLSVAAPIVRQDETIFSTDIPKKVEPEYDPMKKRDIFRNLKEIQAESTVENPVVAHDTPESDHMETDNNMDNGTARGHEDAISDIPLGGTGVVGVMGVGGGGLAGCFGYRDGGGRKKAVGRFGGSEATESAVEAALRWLARHQEADGHWEASKYDIDEKKEIRVGCTGLALLAFLGAGYTEKTGKFADNVKRAEQWLMSAQKPSGVVAEQEGGWNTTIVGYNHAIAGLALAEAYGMGKDQKIGDVAQKAVDYSLKIHQNPYSGWRYDAKEAPDTSVTGWFVMQLKSAKIAGLKVDGSGFQGAQTWLDKVTTKDGHAGYQGASDNFTSMTAVGMVCRQFMGTPNTDPLLVGGAEQLVKEPPDWQRAGTVKKWDSSAYDQSFYYWYYGTLAMFQMGGEKWTKWNETLKPTLIKHQCQGPLPLSSEVTDKDGSWDPQNWVDLCGGRVFTTAAGALTLEVYYRYLPMYTK